MKNRISFCLCVLLLAGNRVFTQIPVELFGGHQRLTADVMFFKNFHTSDGNSSPFLFFNRTRASVDYRMTSQTYLPLFGITSAISYNSPKMRGFAPVMVGQIVSWGVYPKAGIQFVKLDKSFTIFSWLVTELLRKPDLDFFFLARYTPSVGPKWKLFLQSEFLLSFPMYTTPAASFTERFRIGLKRDSWQWGLATDLAQSISQNFTNSSHNTALFLRYEF